MSKKATVSSLYACAAAIHKKRESIMHVNNGVIPFHQYCLKISLYRSNLRISRGLLSGVFINTHHTC
jgi:hypothetical protein